MNNIFDNPTPQELDQREREKELRKPTYVSKQGFVTAPVHRGLVEAQKVMQFIIDSGAVAFLCGGFVRYMASINPNPAKPSDIDIYCMYPEGFELLKKQAEKVGLVQYYENTMAVTYNTVKDPSHPLFACGSLQLIKPVKESKVVAIGTMAEILENFDFTVVRAGWPLPFGSDTTGSYDGLKCLVDADFEHDEAARILRLKNIHCPVGSTLRCMKYSRKGYWLPPTQALKLFQDWDLRDNSWRAQLIQYLKQTETGEGLTQEQIDDLEAMMRVD